MSHENVDLFLRVADAINAREVPDALIAPDFHIENIVTAVSDKTYHGAAGHASGSATPSTRSPRELAMKSRRSSPMVMISWLLASP